MREILNTVIDEVSSAARYEWPALAVAWLICLLGWAVVMALPNVYESSARVFADARTALSPVIRDIAIQQDVNAQLNLVQETLLSEEQLDRVIDETDFAALATTETDRAKIRRKLRDHIDITMQRSGDYINPGGSILWLSYRDPDRDRSLDVVGILLEAFLSGTEGGKRENSEAAQEFLTREIAENEAKLREAENRLAEFKKENVGTMPGAEGDYFTRLQNEIDLNRDARTALSIAIAKRDELNRQLREGASAAVGGVAAIRAPGQGGPANMLDTAGRLAEARQKLKDLLMTYTEKHPEVSVLRAEIADLERQRAEEMDAVRRGDQEAVIATGASANPVYQSIQLALNETNLQIASLRGEIGQHEQKIAELRKAVQTVPEVEAELVRLNRDYDVTKTQYLALIERKEKAELGQSAEESKSGVILKVIDPPAASIDPVAPKRPLLVSLVFLAGLGCAVALAYALGKVNPVFTQSRELERVTGREVLGVVSLTTFDDYRAAARRSHFRYGAMAAALLLAFIAMFLVSYAAPQLRDLA
jgi:polysaccharide chain length determinant protein (PEP-CTERM system associated)